PTRWRSRCTATPPLGWRTEGSALDVGPAVAQQATLPLPLAQDALSRLVVPHPLRIADLVHFVTGDLHLARDAERGSRAVHPAPRRGTRQRARPRGAGSTPRRALSAAEWVRLHTGEAPDSLPRPDGWPPS